MKDKYQVDLIRAIRIFFDQHCFDEILAPPMVAQPGIDPHIHPFAIHSLYHKKMTPLYLHTSPEFFMKHKLAMGHKNIYSLGYCFRDEPSSPIHSPQFLMLEWYRAHQPYEKIMEDCEWLIQSCSQKLETAGHHPIQIPPSFTRKTLQELFQEILGLDLTSLMTPKALKACLQNQFPDIPLPQQQDLTWEDYYFLLFLNKIEPELKRFPFLILSEFPAPLAALSKIKSNNPSVCLRFEVYINGIEICNCFEELTDYPEQLRRSQESLRSKKEIYRYELPPPEMLFNALNQDMPNSSGIAMGIDRLAMVLLDETDLFFAQP